MVQILLLIFILIYAIQFIYWLLFLIANAKYKKYSPAKKIGTNPVSVIVCAYNELDNLKRLIPILLNQKYNIFEVIVVNDCSDDGTYDFLNIEKNKYSRLKIVNIDKIHDHISAKKYAITLGVKAAKHDLLLFTDVDCTPSSEHWISGMSASVDESIAFILGYSAYEKQSGFLNAFIRFETRLIGIFYTTFALLGNPYMGVGRNMMYRKSLFMKHNGFNKFQNVIGGDDDLFVNQFANGLNTRISLGKESLVWSVPKTSWKLFFRQKKRHLSVSKFYKFKDKFLLGLYSVTHVLFWIMFLFIANLNIFPEILIWIGLVRVLMITIVVAVTSKKYGEPMNIWIIPAFDFIYLFYVIIVAINAIFTKNITWR